MVSIFPLYSRMQCSRVREGVERYCPLELASMPGFFTILHAFETLATRVHAVRNLSRLICVIFPAKK